VKRGYAFELRTLYARTIYARTPWTTGRSGIDFARALAANGFAHLIRVGRCSWTFAAGRTTEFFAAA
jgi:hypothetical protein